LLLIYPFNVEETELSAAANGLKELGGELLGLDQANARSMQGQLDKGNTAKRIKKPKRTHYVTIQDNDKERLCQVNGSTMHLLNFGCSGKIILSLHDLHVFCCH
jgi:hypothetical protein